MKIALPLVNKLKNLVRSLYREVLDLRSRLKKQEDFWEYKERSTEYMMKIKRENEELRDKATAYDNIRIAVGKEECEKLERKGNIIKLDSGKQVRTRQLKR